MELIKKSEWARRKGFSKAYVSKLVKQGKIPTFGGLIDEDGADYALQCFCDPTKSLMRNIDENSVYNDLHMQYMEAKLKCEIERGHLLEAKVKDIEKKYVCADEVMKSATEQDRVIRKEVLKIPDRVSAAIAASSDASEIYDILTKEIRATLFKLSSETQPNVDC